MPLFYCFPRNNDGWFSISHFIIETLQRQCLVFIGWLHGSDIIPLTSFREYEATT